MARSYSRALFLLLTLLTFSCSKKSTGPELPRIILSESSWSLATYFNGPTSNRMISVSIEGGAKRVYALSKSQDWLTLQATDSITPFDLSITPSSLNLAAGVHVDTIRISAQAVENSPARYIVTLTIGPSLELSSKSASITAVKGKSGTTPLSTTVSSGSGPELPFTYNGATPWLSVLPAPLTPGGDSLVTPRVMSLTFDPNKFELATGKSITSLQFQSLGAGNAPLTYLCSLDVTSWYSQVAALLLDYGDVQFIDPDNGWIVGFTTSVVSGAAGVVYRTRDGGASWSEQSLFLPYRIGGAHFKDLSTGWVCADTGRIHFTTDGGTSWSPPDTLGEHDLNDIFFIDADYGWIVGEAGSAYRTTDGGTSWDTLTTPTTLDLVSVHFRTRDSGFVVGLAGVTLHTVNGGGSWTENNLEQRDLRDVYAITGQTALAVGSKGRIWRTTSGGAIWSNQNTADTLSQFFAVWFADDRYGWAAGGNGRIFYSSDRGMTWFRQDNDDDEWLFDVFATDSGNVWTVGANATVRRSDFGGR